MRARAAVRVDDDLAPGEARVAHRPARHEAPGRIDVEDALLAVDHLGRDCRQDDVLDDVGADLLVGDLGAVLRGDDDRLHPGGLAVHVAHAHLRLAVGADVVDGARLAPLGQPHHELVGEHDRQRHQLGCLVARVAEHEALVTGAEVVHPHRDVRGLLIDGGDDTARLEVEAVLGARVADLADRLAGDARDVHVAVGGDLAGDDDEARGQQRLTRDPPRRVLADDRVQHRIGHLVGDLVGVTLGHRLRREEMFISRHRQALLRWSSRHCSTLRRGLSRRRPPHATFELVEERHAPRIAAAEHRQVIGRPLAEVREREQPREPAGAAAARLAEAAR